MILSFPKLSQVVLVPKLDQTVKVLHRHTDTEGKSCGSVFDDQSNSFESSAPVFRLSFKWSLFCWFCCKSLWMKVVTLSSYIPTCGSLQLWPLWPAAADVTWNNCSKLNPVTQLHFWHVRPEPTKSLCHVLPAAACCRFQKEKRSHVGREMDPVELPTLLPLISLHHLHGEKKKSP